MARAAFAQCCCQHMVVLLRMVQQMTAVPCAGQSPLAAIDASNSKSCQPLAAGPDNGADPMAAGFSPGVLALRS